MDAERERAYILRTSIKLPSSETAFECYQFYRIFLMVAQDRYVLILHNALKVRVFNGEMGLDLVQIEWSKSNRLDSVQKFSNQQEP